MKQLKDFILKEPDIRTYASGDIDNSALVGLEVELERYENPADHKYWRCEHDGSLRDGGIEFVLRQPLTGVDLDKSIKELYEEIITKKHVTNQRCSTHVHIDARDMTVPHLQAMVFVYSMVERMVYDNVAPEREDSFYCTPLYNSTKHRRLFSTALDKLNFERCPKYSGLNLRTLHRYGSLEFRMYEGITASKDLRKWVKMLMRLKSGTKQYENVPLTEILKLYSERTAESIIYAVFGDMARELLQGGDYNARLKSSMRSAQDLLLLAQKPLSKYESTWASELGGAKNIEGVDPEIMEILRARRDELFGN